jgi:hypothetical protein
VGEGFLFFFLLNYCYTVLGKQGQRGADVDPKIQKRIINFTINVAKISGNDSNKSKFDS